MSIVDELHDLGERVADDARERFKAAAAVLEKRAVEPYRAKMARLAGDFILGTDDGDGYERDVSILRLAAPRSDVPALTDFMERTAEELVEAHAAEGRLNVADVAKRAPAR